MSKRAIPEGTRRAVARRYGCEPGETLTDVPCHWCGDPGSIEWHRLASGKPGAWVSFTHELDHVIPEASGGSHDPDNIVLACRSCNRRRGHRDSLHPHVILTELGEPYSLHPHDRKGREGKWNREGKGLLVPLQNQTTVCRAPGGALGLGFFDE